ncbi:MAG: FmdB family zinc ribbon protein [Chloroflexota bacterium]
MPLYEYECRSCASRFERRQSVNDEPVRECPDCGAVVRRVLFPASIIFKGSGWYVTDSRGKQPIGSPNSNGTGGSNGSGDKSEGASGGADPKPAASESKNSKPSTETAAAKA